VFATRLKKALVYERLQRYNKPIITRCKLTPYVANERITK